MSVHRLDGEIENVRVVIRVRPMNRKETICQMEHVILTDGANGLLMLRKPKSTEKPKIFKFDHIFTEYSLQKDVYKYVAFPIVEKVIQGYNGTIIAYGQTGTGKTYTMAGKNDEVNQGIIPNTFNHIFSIISNMRQSRSFVVNVTYLEIYNEDVRDLLSTNPGQKLEVRERLDLGVYVQNLMGFTVDSIKSITRLMERGNQNRITRSTLMNDVSSRSHAIFTITIEARDEDNNKTTVGKLNLVDLAGSERLSRTHAKGDRLKEAGSINQSLSVLGNVISALVDGRSTYIPYRNSKLTRLLQDSLGGNSKTVMIAMVSPAEIDYEESLCTLRYASRVKYIKNNTKLNIGANKGLIERFEEKIAQLKEKISQITINEQSPKRVRKHKLLDTSSDELIKCNEELLKAEEEKEIIMKKIAVIQKKILVGGENLFEKAQRQKFLLEMSGHELQCLNRSRVELEENLAKTALEQSEVMEQFSTLQEENEVLNKKVTKAISLLIEAKEQLADKKQEYEKEVEILSENYRQLMKDFKFVNKVIDEYIPKSYLKKIEDKIIWNDKIGDFQIVKVAHAGNNMQDDGEDPHPLLKRSIKPSFHTYSSWKRRTQGVNLQKRYY